MIRGFWIPTNGKRAVLLIALLLMVVLRQSELIGLMDSTVLVFGWLPIQLAYDIAIGLVATVIAYGIYIEAPEPPAKYEPTVESTTSETVTEVDD